MLLVLVVIAVSFAISYWYLNAEYRQGDEENQLQTVGFFQHYFQRDWSQSPERIDRQCDDLMRNSSDRLTVIARDGRVLGDSEADPSAMENHNTPDRPEVIHALKGQSISVIRRSETLGIEFRIIMMRW